MNKAYRLLKNKFNGSVTVAHERAKGRGSSSVKKSLLSVAITAALMGMFSESSQALGLCDTGLCNNIETGFNIEIPVTNSTSFGNSNSSFAILNSSSVEHFHLNITDDISSNFTSALGLYNSDNFGSLVTNNISNNVITVLNGVTAESTDASGTDIIAGISLTNYDNGGITSVDNSISRNRIINNGTILGYGRANGIALTNKYNRSVIQTDGLISENTISNIGTIKTDNNGVFLSNNTNSNNKYSGGDTTSAISANTINNTGIIQAGYAGIALVNYDNQSVKYNNELISSNTITNSGSITADNVGIDLYNQNFGSNHTDTELNTASSGAANATSYRKYAARSQIASNTITNAMGGSIVSDADGIRLNGGVEANANTYSSTGLADYNYSNNVDGLGNASINVTNRNISSSGATLSNAVASDATTYSSSISSMSDNTISNHGTIAHNNHGILINTQSDSFSKAVAVSGTYVNHSTGIDNVNSSATAESSADANAYAQAFSQAIGNTITNTGSIAVIGEGGLSGISISTGAYSETYTRTVSFAMAKASSFYENENATAIASSDNSFTSIALALNADNTIINTGAIQSSGRGINISADAEGKNTAVNDAIAEAANTETVIRDSSGNSIVFAANKYANRIENSGSIIASGDTGIAIQAYATNLDTGTFSSSFDGSGNKYGNVSTVLATNKYSSVTNTGSITAYNEGISVQATAYQDNNNSGHAGISAAYNLINTITNSGTIVAGEDGILISSFARTTTSGNGFGGTSTLYSDAGALNKYNQVVNSGSIISSDGDGIKIGAYASNTVGDASGNLLNNINNAYAFNVGNTVTNSGSIVALNGSGINVLSEARFSPNINSYGYAASLDNTITNSGSIVASENGIALRAVTYEPNVITTDGDGTALVLDNNISNTGTIRVGQLGILIEAQGQPAGEGYGKYFYGNLANNTISNSGLIVSTATTNDFTGAIGNGHSGFSDAFAIKAIGYANADASGVFFDTSGTYFSNTLNLSAPAFIGGRLALQQEANFKVNLTSGPSHSNNWTFDKNISIYDASGTPVYNILNPSSNVTTQGAVPWFRNDNNLNYATIDPSAFAAAPNLLADTAQMVSSMSKTSLDRNVNGQKSNTWLSVQGNAFSYDGDNVATLKQKTRLYGIAGGYSEQISPDTVLGGTVGYNRNELKVSDRFTSSYDNTSDGAFVGLFGRTKLAQTFTIDAALNGGFGQHNDSRFVNDNLEYLGVSSAKSKYNSTWLSPEVSLSLPYDVKGMFTVSPNVQLRYASQWIDGYTETGSHANANVGSRTVSIADSKIGLSVAKVFNRGYVNAHISYLNRESLGDDKVNVAMIGDTHNVSSYYKSITAGIVGLDARYDLYKGLSLQASGNYMSGSNVTGGSLTGSIYYLF
jgi:hypothetical protein